MENEIKIDKRDRKILALLDFNARMSNAEIARKIRISKEAMLYRIKNLEKNGIIKQYYAIINPAKLGYYYCRLLLKFQNITKNVEERLIKWLEKNPKTAYLGIVDGFYDLVVGYWAKELSEFENFVDKLVFDYGKYILEKEVSIGMRVWQFPYKFLLSKVKTESIKEFKTGGKLEILNLDEIDKSILVLLTKNARMSYEELSRHLKLSGKAIKYRIKNLLKQKVIVGFRTLIDYTKFGFYNTKVLLYLQNLTKEKLNALINYLRTMQNCIYITKAVWKPDLEFEVLTKKREEFFSIMGNLRENFKSIIKAYDHLIIYKELVSRFVPIS